MTIILVSRVVNKAMLFVALLREDSPVGLMFDPTAVGVVMHDSLRGYWASEGAGSSTPPLVFRYGLHMTPLIPEVVINELGVAADLTVRGVQGRTFVPWSSVFVLISEKEGAIVVDDTPPHCAVELSPPARAETPSKKETPAPARPPRPRRWPPRGWPSKGGRT